MKAILEKLGVVFSEHGEKIGLSVAGVILIVASCCSGLVIPDVEGKVSDLDGFMTTVASAKAQAFPEPLPDPSRPKTDDFRWSVPDLAFPVGKELNRLVDRGGYIDFGVVSFLEGHEETCDVTEAMGPFKIGKIVIVDKADKPTTVVTAKVVSDASVKKVTFTAAQLPADSKGWEGRFTIDRQSANTTAATGILKVEKIREKSRLRDLPEISGVAEADPLKLGCNRVSWKPAVVAPQPIDKVRYLVERREGNLTSGRWSLVTPAPIDGPSFDDSDPAIEPGKTYLYRVRAVLGPGIEASHDQIEAFTVPGRPEARVTVPAKPCLIDVPYTVMFRIDGFPSSGERVSFTVWIWDVAKREWQTHKNVYIDPGQEIGLYAKEVLVKGTGIKVASIWKGERKIHVKGVAAESRYDDDLTADTVHHLVRPTVSGRSDLAVFKGTPPGAAALPKGPDREVDTSLEPAWKEEIKAIQAGIREINKLITADKFDGASAKIGEFSGKAAAAEQKMEGDFKRQARDLKRDLESLSKKIQSERKKAEEKAKKDKDESPLR